MQIVDNHFNKLGGQIVKPPIITNIFSSYYLEVYSKYIFSMLFFNLWLRVPRESNIFKQFIHFFSCWYRVFASSSIKNIFISSPVFHRHIPVCSTLGCDYKSKRQGTIVLSEGLSLYIWGTYGHFKSVSYKS